MSGSGALTRMACVGIFLLAATGCEDTSSDTTDVSSPSTDSAASEATSSAENDAQSVAIKTPDGPFRFAQILPSETGIDFRHVSGDSEEKPFPAANGSGGGAIDLDMDGLIDLYFATGRTFPIEPAEGAPANRMYRNRGQWKFQDVTAESGLGYQGYSAAVAVGDVDGDGFPDVCVTCFGENQLFINHGDGTFARRAIPPTGNFSTSAAWLDYDSDGLLDLYVGNYGDWTWEENLYCGDRSRNVRIFCSPNSLEGEPDCLLKNLGDGTFRDVTSEAGLDVTTGRAQGVLATDVNADGRIDLYIGNDIHPNFLFLNEGNGHFRDVTELTGAAYDENGQMQAGMGVASADVDRDGMFDLFVTNFEREYNTLYLQSAADTYFDSSATNGLAAESRPWVGWGTAFVDFDLDGWKDLIVCNGHVDNNLDQMGRDSPYEQPSLIWKNEAGRFRFVGGSAGPYFQSPHPARGLITADLDNDGDTDIVITHQDQSPGILRNDTAGTVGTSSSVTVRLIGRRSNRDAVGAQVVIRSGGRPRIEQIQNGGSYLSAHDPRLIVAVEGGDDTSMQLIWPSGIRSEATNLKPMVSYDIVEPDGNEQQTLIHRNFPDR